jgi:hypothetical protein
MPWLVEHDPNLGAVRITVHDSLSIVDAKKMSQHALSIARDQATFRILADLTALTSTPHLVDIFAMPTHYHDSGVDGRYRTAVVLPADEALHEDARFHETVCRNRGLEVRVFATVEEATRWLTG